jgi:hypothetical protein
MYGLLHRSNAEVGEVMSDMIEIWVTVTDD